jgi:hypothetical protein
MAILLFIFNFLFFFHHQKDFMFFESKQEDDSSWKICDNKQWRITEVIITRKVHQNN